MRNKKIALYLSGLVACFVVYAGGAVLAQKKTAAPSITVYQDPT